MRLLVVESPTKTKTFAKLLDKAEYEITSTMGHIRDLPANKLGVDVDNDFAPDYVVIPNKVKTVSALVALAKKADTVILATDPDREGEAISYHLAALLQEKVKKKLVFERITFHEITEEAIGEALKTPHELNVKLFHAQQARRVVDRLVGYKVSPYLWKRFTKRWLSAGRVQTVALRFLVERFKERGAFASREYFVVKGMFDQGKESMEAKLIELSGEPFYKTTKIELFDGTYQYQESLLSDDKKAKEEVRRLEKETYTIKAITESTFERAPSPPFTTSLMQQFGSNYLSFSAKKTMQVAQSLYEQGVITYHRTDSMSMSEKFVSDARGYIQKTYGKEYLSDAPRAYKTKSKTAQEAHEAIRPTKTSQVPSMMENLSKDQLKLYTAIYNRAVSTQMKEARLLKQKITITSKSRDVFQADYQEVLFPGFLVLYKEEEEEAKKPKKLKESEVINLKEIISEKKQTQPPPNYTEASLIKTLEERGIGRPSTYAPILSLLEERQYVKKESKALIATELGIKIADVLIEKFKDVFDVGFTALMEDHLDEIALGNKQWQKVVRAVFDPLTKELDAAYKDTEKIRIEEKTGEMCPTCGKELVIKLSRFGKFYACSGFPECRYTKPFLQSIDVKCPKCGEGNVIVRFSRKKKRFYACDRYPACDFTSLWPPKKDAVAAPSTSPEV